MLVGGVYVFKRVSYGVDGVGVGVRRWWGIRGLVGWWDLGVACG